MGDATTIGSVGTSLRRRLTLGELRNADQPLIYLMALTSSSAMAVDAVYHNADVYTVDPNQPWVSAFAVTTVSSWPWAATAR